MIPLITRLIPARPRPTPSELAKDFRHVRVIPEVITRLPNRNVPARHCNGPTCFHDHAGASRPFEVRKGRRWIAA